MCAPDLGPDDALLTSTRIVAVRAEPAEAAPGSTVTFTALVAAPGGGIAAPPIVWSFCSAPKPLTDDDVVSNACLDSSSLVGAGRGVATTTATPSNGCSSFGPDAPAGGFRPQDPDITGGYYQPLRVDLTGAPTAFDLARIRCDLANAGATAAARFAAAYVNNDNPHLLPLTANGGAIASVAAGARVILQAAWPAADAETYAYFDPASQSVTTKREAMQVAWYSSSGALDTESTGRAEDDFTTTSDDGWTAPSAPTTAHLWVVLRDSRGGVDFAEYDVVVE
jgi:hypothetical protein